MTITSAVRTDRGKVRSRNEDAFGIFPELQTYVVADGIGGQQGGVVASTLTVETIRRALQDVVAPPPDKRGEDATQPVVAQRRTAGACAGVGVESVSIIIARHGHYRCSRILQLVPAGRRDLSCRRHEGVSAPRYRPGAID